MRLERPVRALVLLALAGLLVPNAAEARRRFVPREYKSLQAAIDHADPGDTLWVAGGSYRGPFTLKKPLVLFGAGGPDSTFLEGNDSVRVLHVEGVKGGQLIGFGVRGGKAVAGGGVYCLRDTSFSIDFCNFERNWESGFAAWECALLKLSDCRFQENLGSALQFNRTTGFVLRCEFRRNRGVGGGAIALYQSEILVSLRQCSFEENRAESAMGGAISADSSRVPIVNCSFTRNTSSIAGGAIAAINRSFVTISRCDLKENRAAQGGGAHADASQFWVAYSIFNQNHATAGGAAISVLSRAEANINPTFNNNTFYKNSTEGSGATVFAVKSSPEIRKNIFVIDGKDQVAVAGIDSSPFFDCNLLHNPSGLAPGALFSANTLVGDPLFCDAPAGNFDLRDLSPATRASCGPIGARPQGCSTFKLQPSR